MQRAALVRSGLLPLWFRPAECEAYRKAIGTFVEKDEARPYAEWFLRTYRYTIDFLLGRLPEQIASVAEDEARLQAAWAERRARKRAE